MSAETKRFLNKTEKMMGLFDFVASKGHQLLRTCNMNMGANIMIVVEHSTTDEVVLKKMKELIEKQGFNWYDVYLTQLSKTEKENVDMKILENEVKILEPKKIVYLGHKPYFEKDKSYSMPKERYDVFKMMVENPDKKTECFSGLANEVIYAVIEFAFKGVSVDESV